MHCSHSCMTGLLTSGMSSSKFCAWFMLLHWLSTTIIFNNASCLCGNRGCGGSSQSAAEVLFDSVTSCKQIDINLYPGIAFELQWLMHDAGTDKSH